MDILKSQNYHKKVFDIGLLKKSLRNYSIQIQDNVLDTLFNSKLDKKEEKSFRVIRNKVCHSCSIKYRDFGNEYSNMYNSMMDTFIDSIKELVSF